MDVPFHFGLQRVRDLRAHDEDAAKEQFAASLSQRVRGEAMLRSADELLRSARADGIVPVDGGAMSGVTLLARQAWVERLERSQLDAQARLRGLDVELEAKRDELATASRERQVLDQLEDRQREAHRLASERREGVELDEMAQRVHARRLAA